MAWFVGLIIVVVAAILLILFLNRYFRKATREIAIVRTGAGGQKVVLDGGCLALPFLHKVAEVNMRTSRLEIERLGPKSIITKDRLRVDVGAEFYVRVEGTATGVATAAQALAGKSFRPAELAETLEGKLVDAMLSVAARYTMDELQDNRGGYAREISEVLKENLAQNGLMLESVSLTRIDQTPFHALDENNAFNALGMRRLAEIIAVNKKERAAIESEAEVAVRQSHLDATKRKLTISREEEEAMIQQQRDREVRRKALDSELATALARAENAVQLAAKRVEEAEAEAAAVAAKAGEAKAEEDVRTVRETAAAERQKALALIRASEQAAVDDTRVKSEADTILSMASAEAKATLERAKAARDRLLAEAEGRVAVIAAENGQSEALISMKLEEARLRALPEVVERMLKPAERIESIRINHISGFGGAGGGREGATAGEPGAVNQVVDSVLAMALQLPAVKRLGEEVGLNVGGGLDGLAEGLARRSDAPKPKTD